MSISKVQLKENLLFLIEDKYSMPPKVFELEELAVQQSIQQLTLFLSHQKEDERVDLNFLLPNFPITSIENMIRLGQLTLVAENIGDNFLPAIEQLIKKSDMTFKSTGNLGIKSISKLYSESHKQLKISLNREPYFSEILLRMYTEETAFYEKINAIAGGYVKENQTTDEEKNSHYYSTLQFTRQV